MRRKQQTAFICHRSFDIRQLTSMAASKSVQLTRPSLLVSEKGMSHISTGELFRAAMKNQTALGKKAKSFMDAGQLVPDDVTIGLVEEVFEQKTNKDVILDGFPRTVAHALETLHEFGSIL